MPQTKPNQEFIKWASNFLKAFDDIVYQVKEGSIDLYFIENGVAEYEPFLENIRTKEELLALISEAYIPFKMNEINLARVKGR